MKLLIQIGFLLCISGHIQAQAVKYVMQGRAYYDGTSQIYKLRVTDDGSGNIKGENVSILPSGRVLIGPVKGVIDYKRQTIFFQELQIANLPKGERQEDFCFFTITASFKIIQGKTVINGTFTSKHPSGAKCSGGTIYLIGDRDVTEIRKQYVKRIEEEKAKALKNNLPKPAPKPKPVIVKKKPPPPPPKPKPVIEVPKIVVVDTPPPPPIPKPVQPQIPQGAKVYEYNNDVLTFSIIDYDQNDGDRIDLFINGKPILQNFLISVEGFTFDVDLKALGNGTGLDIISMYSVSAGSYAPTSAKFIILDKDQKFTQFAGTDLNKTFYLALKKKKQELETAEGVPQEK